MSPLDVTLVAVFGTGFLSWVAWTANTLYKHAQVMAATAAELKALLPIPGRIDDLADQITEVRIEQARVRQELGSH